MTLLSKTGLAIAGLAYAAWLPAADFELVALGVNGGLSDGNLSSWLVRRPGDAHYLALDAGSVLPGIDKALQQGAFADRVPPKDSDLTPAGYVLREVIGGYFISHAHLDHVAGLLIAATDDSRKPIYGLASTLQTLSGDYFNWAAWPNFSDGGAAPQLKQYRLSVQAPGVPFAIAGTALMATIHPLAHDRIESSMILLRSGDAYLAYFGDTGPDELQRSTRLADIWQALGALRKRGQLKGLVIECSYPDEVVDTQLYGHLKPAWLLRELQKLEAAAGGTESLRGLDVVISHIKPSLKAGADPRAQIAAQLAGNTFGVRFHLPLQGEHFGLPRPDGASGSPFN